MNQRAKLWGVLWPFGVSILAVWAVTILALITSSMIADASAAKERKAFEDRPFSDFKKYHGIYPIQKTAGYGSLAIFISDSEVREVPAAGFGLDWQEHIECDYRPYDGKSNFEYYAEVHPTGRRFTEKSTRRPLEDLEGWIAYERARSEGEPRQPVQYPHRDADCRLYSFMIMNIKGATKYLPMFSDVVHVRGEHFH